MCVLEVLWYFSEITCKLSLLQWQTTRDGQDSQGSVPLVLTSCCQLSSCYETLEANAPSVDHISSIYAHDYS